MKQAREIKNFIFSQYFYDGLRITFGVLLPSIIMAQLGMLHIGLVVSMGAFTTSLGDNPGPVTHKRNGMLLAMVFTVLTAILTGLINQSPVLLFLGLLVFCFFFSMLAVYGDRASNIGTASLLVMVLTIDQKLAMQQNLQHALYILGGGVWYFLLSTSLLRLMPYRQAQQELAVCIRKVADYLRVKAQFYNIEQDFDATYTKLVSEQVLVHKQQDVVREIMFKTRLIVKESTTTSRLLVMVFVDVIDLFEQTMATHYDYKKIRNNFGNTDALRNFNKVLVKIAEELENMSYYINSNTQPVPLYNLQIELEQLKFAIDRVEVDHRVNNIVLKKILINVRNIVGRIQKIYSYFEQKHILSEKTGKIDVGKFVSPNDYESKVFRENLTFESGIFRHSVRVAIGAIIGYLVSKALPLGDQSYWILLTILVILKPAFSLTKKRNIERLIGTFIGGIAGVLIIVLIKDENIRLSFMVVFMLLTYSFLRHNYIVGVLFLTPYILILFSFVGNAGLDVAKERFIDTILGGIIAFGASHYIFPSWEYRHLKGYMKGILKAHYNYLLIAAEKLSGKRLDITDYKLKRKEVYVKTANLASAFQRMLSEPKSKQKNVEEVHRFVVLNHILSSYIATFIASLQQKDNQLANSQQIRLIKKALYQLNEAERRLEPDAAGDMLAPHEVRLPDNLAKDGEENIDSALLTEQLELVHKLCSDINKTSGKVLGETERSKL